MAELTVLDQKTSYFKINDEDYINYWYDIKGKTKCHIIDKDLILKNEKEFFQPVIYKVNIDVKRNK